MSEIDTIVKRDVITPLKPVHKLESKRIRIKIVKVEEPEKLYSYLRLLSEGEDAEELFEV